MIMILKKWENKTNVTIYIEFLLSNMIKLFFTSMDSDCLGPILIFIYLFIKINTCTFVHVQVCLY